MTRRVLQQRAAVAAVLSAMALVVLDAGALNVALPTIARVFGETPARSTLAVTAYQLALLAGLLPCAHVAERIGQRRLFVGGVLLFTGAAFLSALAPTLPLLAAARGLQGVGAAAVMALGMALLRATLGAERLGAVIGWNASVVAICSALAPAIGALILSFASWRWLFVAALPTAAIALLAAPSLPAAAGTRRAVDGAAIALYAAAAGCAVAAASLARTSAVAAVAAAIGALAFGYALFVRDRGKASPLLPIDLLALRPLRTAAAASTLFFLGQSGGLIALPFYLQLSLGRSAATTGLILALWPIAVATTSRFANGLATRFGSALVCSAGAVTLAAGLAATAAWPIAGSVVPLAVAALVSGTGFGLFQVSNNRTLFLTAPAHRSAAAGGVQATARLCGQAAGALLVAHVLASATPAVAPRLAIGTAAVAALLAAWVSRPRAVTAAAMDRSGFCC